VSRRQEQETARSHVKEVAPDILRMELPIRIPGLGHVNCYAVLDRNGAAVVDPGLPGPGTWRAIQDRLRKADLAVKHVHTVIVTHSHPDHFGGAARFAKEAGAEIVAHRSFSFGPPPAAGPDPEVSVADLTADPTNDEEPDEAPETVEDQRTTEALASFATRRTPWGGERAHFSFHARLRWWAIRLIGTRIVPIITHPVEHGDVLELAGREWFVVHTPGHTGDHVCFHDPEMGIFLAGDHVLPSITPHISGLTSSPDPLSSYFYSLDRVSEFVGVKQVLPAHGHPFSDLKERAEAIKRHHHERLETIKSISRELGPASVQQFSRRLFPPRSWGSMAESETYAHLEHLRLAGEAERRVEKDGTLLYATG
jgi:glyoxylase-like metal-dependent hydrolase (beta-lactamase superfamily II)